MCPFGIAEKSYAVTNRGEEKIAFESQLIHAVVEARAPLNGRLRYEVIGESQHRLCFRQNSTVGTSTIGARRITGVEALRSRTTRRSMGSIEYGGATP
jgi:hypothetical protein